MRRLTPRPKTAIKPSRPEPQDKICAHPGCTNWAHHGEPDQYMRTVWWCAEHVPEAAS